MTVQRSVYQGPFPLPEHMREYQQIVPDFGERITKNFENQSEHRRDMERENQRENFRLARTGQVLAGLIGVGAIASTTYLISLDKDIQGFGVFLAALVPILLAFLRTRQPPPPQQ